MGPSRREVAVNNMLYQSLCAQNEILRHLPAHALASLQPHLRRIRLQRRAILQEAYSPVEAVFFIERGMAAVLAQTQQGGQVEVGIIGRSGLVGVPALLGTAHSPHRCQVEVEGEALQIDARTIARVMNEHASLRQSLMNYVQALLVHNSQTAMCNTRHDLVQRLARWLLLAHDRLAGDLIPLTHELMSMMLGVRRASVTGALAQMEATGALKKARGAVIIADAAQLERYACECYRIITDEYARLIDLDAPEVVRPERHSVGPAAETIERRRA